MDEWLSPELLIRRLAAAHELIRQKKVAPLIDYKFVVVKNFDAQDQMTPMLEESGSKNFYFSKRVGQNLFASEWMMFV